MERRRVFFVGWWEGAETDNQPEENLRLESQIIIIFTIQFEYKSSIAIDLLIKKKKTEVGLVLTIEIIRMTQRLLQILSTRCIWHVSMTDS